MDPQALDLANKTLAAAIDSLMAKGSPFLPIVLVEKGGQREVRRVSSGRGEDPVVVARQLAASETDADATAFAVHGTIPFDGGRSDAIIVEAWNFRASRGARIGLRYELKGALRKKPSLLGSPLHLGREGWYDPEDGEPAPAPAPPAPAPAAPDLTEGYGPPPTPSSLAPAEATPPAPRSTFGPAVPTEPPALPKAFVAPSAVAPLAPPAVAPDFGPPPTSPPVPGFAPPTSAPPIADTAPPSAAHPVDVPPAPAGDAPPVYAPVPIQRSETPLGNRAMFAGIMELATKGRSFPAFAIVQKDGAWEQVTMTDASLEDAAASVRAYARTRTDAEFIAFAVDGTVPVGDTRADAVIVEVWEYATRVSFSVAQRYIPTGDPPSPKLSGRPLMRTQTGWIDVPSAMTLGGQVQFGYRDPEQA